MLSAGWVDNLGLIQPASSAVQVITANPAITTLTAQVTISYRISLSFGSQLHFQPLGLRRAGLLPGRGISARSGVCRLPMLLVDGGNVSNGRQ